MDLTTTNACLEESEACATEGRALLDRAMALRDDAFAALPVGVRLQFKPVQHLEYVVKLTPEGWQIAPDETGRYATPEFVQENWARGNWTVLEPPA